MPDEKIQPLIEKLNVERIKGEVAIIPDLNFKGEFDILSIMFSSSNLNYIRSLARGAEQFLSVKPDIKSEVMLTTPQEFFRPTKPPQYFHYIMLGKDDLQRLCNQCSVNFEDIKEDYEPKINNYYSLKP